MSEDKRVEKIVKYMQYNWEKDAEWLKYLDKSV
jgi:hypothetical protein